MSFTQIARATRRFELNSLRQMVDTNHTLAGRLFNSTIQLLILLSLMAFCLETLPDLTPMQKLKLQLLETVTVIVFSVEYILRLLVAKDRRRFVTSFFGVVDLLAVLPFYVATGVDLRSVRAFRLFRLVRIFKLFRYSKAVVRLHRAVVMVKEELVLFFFAIIILIFLSSVGIYYFEHEAQPETFGSVFHSMWWSMVTLTTVGYGDVYPETIGGRVFTFFVLMTGICIVAVPCGMLASALSAARSEEHARH